MAYTKGELIGTAIIAACWAFLIAVLVFVGCLVACAYSEDREQQRKGRERQEYLIERSGAPVESP